MFSDSVNSVTEEDRACMFVLVDTLRRDNLHWTQGLRIHAATVAGVNQKWMQRTVHVSSVDQTRQYCCDSTSLYTYREVRSWYLGLQKAGA